MLNKIDNNIISLLIYNIDRICRHDLSNGIITNERDYVSNFSTHLRHPFGPFLKFNFIYSKTLENNLESIFGCDSIILFKIGDKVKIGLFEAKWPRFFVQNSYIWDRINQPTASYGPNQSHFGSQLIRQKNWIKSGVVIWEMFFNEQTPGIKSGHFDDFGSSCLFHKDALDYHTKNNITQWNNHHLLNIMNKSINIRRMIYNILKCNYGKLLQITNSEVLLKNREEEVRIPISPQFGENEESLNSFLERSGLKNYFLIDFDLIIKR